MDRKEQSTNQSLGLGRRIFRGTIIIVLVSVLAKLSAFLSEAVNAAYLGTTYQSDAFYMVMSILQMLCPMLTVGIFKVFLPIYKEKITKDDLRGASDLANRMISFFTLISLTAVLLLILFAGPVVSLVAPGFKGETRRLCIELLRISAPAYIFIIDAGIYSAMLRSHNKFFGSQIREVASHVPVILAALFLYRRFGIRAMAASLIAGGMLRLLVELPFVDWGYRYRPNLSIKSQEFGLMLRRLPAAMLSEGVYRINTLVDRAMASSFPAGAVSGMNYGQRLTNVFSGLLSTAVSTALFPQMVELISLKKNEELKKLLTKILNIFVLMMVPVTLACVLFSRDLVVAVFERGAFQEESVELTAGVFTFYSLCLLFVACSSVVSNVFYSFGDTRTPLILSVLVTVVNIMLNLILAHFMGVNGLALATALASVFALIMRMIFVRKYVTFDWKTLGGTFVKVLLASLLSCGTAKIAALLLIENVYLRLLTAAVIGVMLYFAAVKLLRVQETEDLLKLLRKKLRAGRASETGT